MLAADEDGSAFCLYTRVLVAFRENGDSDEQAAALVRDACSANEQNAARRGTARQERSRG